MARTSIRELFRSINHGFPSPISSTHFTKFHLSSSSSTSSIPPENLIYPLQTCQSMRQLFQIQAHLITSGFFQDPFPASRILKFSLDFGDIDYTILIFRHIESPDTFCVNTVIKAYSRTSNPHQALVFYFDMLRKGFLPNSFTFPPLVNSCAKGDSGGVGEKCHGQAIKNGVDNVVPVQNSLIHMYFSFGLIHYAWRLFDGMSQKDLVSWNSVVGGYVELGDLDVAHRIFDKMPSRNVVSWNIMISGYLKAKNPGCGLKLFREMVKAGFRGNDMTMVMVLTACGRSARLKEGSSVHGSLIRNFIKSSVILDTALIDLYSKCKRVEVSRRVFDRMLERNLVCWNAMVLGHCIHGCPQDGITLFTDMTRRVDSKDYGSGHNKIKASLAEEQVVFPDEVTFIGVLCACARAGLLSEGRNYFNQMTNVYGIKPKFAHYWCMANLYAGIGLVKEAVEILSMPREDVDDLSESLLWSGLLGSCRFLGGLDLGERIAMQLIELEPWNASRYMLLSIIYAVAGRWEDYAKVKMMMKERGVGRTPGCSLIDLNEIVHEFKIQDRSNPGMEVVYTMMGELAQRLRLSTTEPTENMN